MAFLGTVAGFILGFSIVYLLEYFDPKVYSQEDLDEKFGMWVWGAVPKQKSQNPDHPSARKAYEMMVANLQAGRKKDHRLRSILITSCNPKEGKTSIAKGLAINSGKAGLNTLLLDGHFKKQAEKSHPNAPDPWGWVEYLEGKTTLEDVMVRLDENAMFLPFGDPKESRTKWLVSKEFESMLDHFSKEYDLVLIDGPSLEEGADSFILSAVAGHVVFVVSKGVSSIKQIMQAKAHVEASGANLLGAILNETRR
jgi:capsular exopolysaccharide synthesis family protein